MFPGHASAALSICPLPRVCSVGSCGHSHMVADPQWRLTGMSSWLPTACRQPSLNNSPNPLLHWASGFDGALLEVLSGLYHFIIKTGYLLTSMILKNCDEIHITENLPSQPFLSVHSGVLRTLTWLCNTCPGLGLAKPKLSSLSTNSPFLPPPSAWQPLFYFLSL